MKQCPAAPQALFVALAIFVLTPVCASAQSAITGVARDTTGLPLPGVTVEASSPALIEQTRTAVTNSGGQYRIIELRPGTYSVTFKLTGFTTVERNGVELQANFTASVDAEMSVGSVEEAITVSGAAPSVDVHTTQHAEVLRRDILDALPTGRNWQTIGTVLPGVSMQRFDVAGSTTMQHSFLTVAGSLPGDLGMLVDGMNVMASHGSGATVSLYHNDEAYQEYVFRTTAGGTAESLSGGVVINMIPKEGSNQLRVDGLALFSNGRLQSSNVDDEQRQRGLRVPARLDKTWDYAASAGFPILKDKFWWFSSYRAWGYNNFAPNALNADGSPGVDDNDVRAFTNRGTYQISSRNKITAVYDWLPKWRGHRNIETGLSDPKATVVQASEGTHITQAKWTSTVTNRLLLEAGYSEHYQRTPLSAQPEVASPRENPPFGDVSHIELSTGRISNAPTTTSLHEYPIYNLISSASYVTGSHALKAGVDYAWGWVEISTFSNGDMVQRYLNGLPNSVQRFNTPSTPHVDMDRLVGLYVQDSWTLNNFTLNAGLRYDLLETSLPEQQAVAGRFVPARHFEAIRFSPYKNFSPRVGVAYNVFGSGKTAVRASVGRYMQQEATGFASRYNPVVVGSDLVTWRDLNGDDLAQDSELGPANNATLGLARNLQPDPELRRPYQLLYNLGLQHELIPRVALSASYYRRRYYDLTYTTNLDVPLSAYTRIDIADPRGNGQTLPVYNLSPQFLGLVNELDTTSANNMRSYNGLDLLIDGRWSNGGRVSGGVSLARMVSTLCDVVDPNELRFCDESEFRIPWSTTVKLSGSHPLPFGMRVSGVLQSVEGFSPALGSSPDYHDKRVTYLVTRAVVPSLTQTQVRVLLDPPGSNYMPRVTQLDLSIGRSFRVGGMAFTPQIDLFNLFNTNTVLSEVTTFGQALGNPATILGPRLIRFQLRTNF